MTWLNNLERFELCPRSLRGPGNQQYAPIRTLCLFLVRCECPTLTLHAPEAVFFTHNAQPQALIQPSCRVGLEHGQT